MGASQFITTAFGSTPKEAFASAREEALYENGHGGYTGSIAEKHDFVLMTNDMYPSFKEALVFAENSIDNADPRIDDKWGPAGYVKFMQGDNVKYLFFGWASS